MNSGFRILTALAGVAMLVTGAAARPPTVERLRATDKLPARLLEHIASPRAFAQTSSGIALVLDGGTQAVYAIDAARTAVRRIVQVGPEPGHVFRPSGFSLGPNDIFAVTDMPGASYYTRVQYFTDAGRLISEFYIPNQPGARQALGRTSLQVAGPLAFNGRTFLFNVPAAGSLMSEFDASGQAVRGIGTLRPTGQEADAALHGALNTGLPLVDPTGGFYFVFETGLPMFRKYDAEGRLLFERHIEGPELDEPMRSLPTRWPARAEGNDAWPFAPGLVHTAAVDRTGRLWVSLTTGYTYVYDRRGDKIRTVQFDAAGPIAPISLFFAKGNRVLVTPGCYEFSSE